MESSDLEGCRPVARGEVARQQRDVAIRRFPMARAYGAPEQPKGEVLQFYSATRTLATSTED
jgi:hypothetical protein